MAVIPMIPAVTVYDLVGLTIDGLSFGLLLAILGISITLVFGLGEVLNLAIGVFAVMGVLTTLSVNNIVSNLLLASLASVVIVGVFGLVVDRTLLSLVYRSEGEERILLGIFVTLGLAIFLDGILINFYSFRYSLPVDIQPVRLGPITVSEASFIIMSISTVLLVALFLFLRYTYLGKATRTVFQDEVGAILCGINPRRMRTIIFVLSAMMAAIAGLLFTISFAVSVADGFKLTIQALIVSIVGGVRSVVGAAFAGILLGIVITYASFFVNSYVANVILFLVAVLVLVARPEAIASEGAEA
ncbi:MAG: branched-chain amino acid ABC transporter permease [Halobacteria archaeon]|nr:branched-chain amino acid ABC transporter permease [Halobacteria archaeon]